MCIHFVVCSCTGRHSLCDSCTRGRRERTGKDGQPDCTGVLWTWRHKRGPGEWSVLLSWCNLPGKECFWTRRSAVVLVRQHIGSYVPHTCAPSCQMLLKELNLGPHKYEFSSLAVSLALEGKASHRELTSRLLSDLSGKLLSQSDIARAFDKMLKELTDLILDTPDAPQVQLLIYIYIYVCYQKSCIML